MDFKKLLNKLDSMDAPVVTPAAPTIPAAIQLNEDAQLRVLSGRSTYVAEAKKKADEDVKEEMKVGDKKPSSSGGEIEKTKTGLKHTAGKNYSGKEAEKEDKKSKQDESLDPAAFKSRFDKMVEAKKAEKKSKKEKMDEASKPDFLDMDKDGDKKEPMKKAVADKKAGPKKGVNPFAKKESVEEAFEKDAPVGSKKKSSTGGEIEKTKTGLKHSSGKNYSSADAPADEAPKKKKSVKESVERKMTFRDMVKLVQESGGQQQIDPVDQALWTWAQRVASAKVQESHKAEIFAGLIYERNGGVFEMYDVLSEDTK